MKMDMKPAAVRSSMAARLAGKIWRGAHEYGVRFVGGEAPRVIFGNDAGFFNNVRGWAESRRLRRLMAGRFARLEHDPRALDLRRHGCVGVDAGFDPALLARIQEKFARLVVDPENSRDLTWIKNASRGIWRTNRVFPELQNLLTGPIQDVLCGYYGSYFGVKNVRCHRTTSVEAGGREVYSDHWHNDEDPTTELRIFIYLTNGVTRETGALRYHSIESTREIMRSGYFRRGHIYGRARRLVDDPARIRYFEGNAGSVALFNPEICLHRASIPKPGSHRDIVQITVHPSEEPLAENWISHCVDADRSE